MDRTNNRKPIEPDEFGPEPPKPALSWGPQDDEGDEVPDADAAQVIVEYMGDDQSFDVTVTVMLANLAAVHRGHGIVGVATVEDVRRAAYLKARDALEALA